MAHSEVPDMFGGTSSQELGEERGEDVVFSVCLKRVRYGSQSTDGHLQWNAHKVKTLQAGSVAKLVEHLAPFQDHVDVTYRTCFLCTYRTFSTTGQVLQLLKERFAAMNPIQGDSMEVVGTKRAVQSAIISFLHVWLESYSSDFYSPPSHPSLNQLDTAFCQHIPGSSCELTRTVEAIRKDFTKKTMFLYADSLLGDLTPRNPCGGDDKGMEPFDLFRLPADGFAQALTAEDAHIFQQVVPHQCLAYARNSRKSYAPTVRAAIDHFNRVSLVVIATVVGGEGSSNVSRAQVMTRWINISQQCRLVKNFSSLKAVVAGLQSSAVFRLSRSWEEVPEEKISLFKELSDLFTADDNHQMSRVLLNREGTGKYPEVSSKKSKDTRNGVGPSAVQGVVPYLGTFLTDLTMIHTAHSDLTKDGLINFNKHRKEFEILAQLMLYQKAAANYSFPPHPPLERWLKDHLLLSEQESYKLSKQLEPDQLGLLSGDSSPDHHGISPPTSLIKKTLRHLFHSKGAAVGDSSPPLRRQLTTSLSDRDLSVSTTKPPATSHSTSTSGLQVAERSSSLSPSLSRKGTAESHIVRVAISNNESCMYKSILLSESDRTSAVIHNALEKHGLYSNTSYSLSQLLDGNKKLKIPDGANVYYALATVPEQATLLLEMKTESSNR